MDSNVSPIAPRAIVVPASGQQGRNKQGQAEPPPFDLENLESPEVVPEGQVAEGNLDTELPVGHAERDEVGRRLDVTG
jgi:hypothetical protein